MEYEHLAIEWTEREKQEHIERAARHEKSPREYEEWINSLPESPRPVILDFSEPSPSPEHSSDISHRVMEGIQKLHSKLQTGAGSDIGGTWRMDCSEISSWYGTSHDAMSRKTDITWIIHPPQTSEPYLWAEISEVIVEGIAKNRMASPIIFFSYLVGLITDKPSSVLLLAVQPAEVVVK